MPLPVPCAAPIRISPLSANQGRGHRFRVPMPPSYSRVDPVRVSPQCMDRGEGAPLQACAHAPVPPPPGGGEGEKKKKGGGGAPLLGLRMPCSHRRCAQG